jgi:uncharacterized protein YndB with AHSA1/START domain
MLDIRHRVGVNAPAGSVFEQLATLEGLRGWWTTDTRGSAETGSTVEFYFGADDRRIFMQVLDATPPERVVWRCVDGPPEWIGSDVTFDLRMDAAETVVLFTHSGWKEPVEFMHHCTSKWGAFLVSLKHHTESGAGRPFPTDDKLSSWD